MPVLQKAVQRITGPRLPRAVRLSLALLITAVGFVCYRWRLTSAHGFMVIGATIIVVVLVIKTVWWQTRGIPQNQV